jgi:hypothetical protein
MRGCAFLLMVAVALALVACGSSGASKTKPDGGGAGDGGASGAAGAGGATGAGGTGGASGGAGTDGPTIGVRDCFPECVAALRRTCERPVFGAGTCSQGTNGTATVYCYSSGVREIRTRIDGGITYNIEFTQPDGQTVCYQVIATGATESFQTASGQEVAQAVNMGGGLWGVTCAGSTTAVTVDINDPSCRTLNSSDCVSGACQ